MDRATKWISAAILILAVATWAGCGPTKKTPDKNTAGTTKPNDHEGHDHDHDHDHDHAHAHGPNGGHIAELDSADKKGEDYHAEWLHDDESGQVTVYLLDADMKNEVGIEAEDISIDIKTGDKTVTYQLKAANRTEGDKPTATRFELIDNALVTILSGDGIDAKIRVMINGMEFSGKIEHHKH